MILVTGATGFVGSALVRKFVSEQEQDVIAAIRQPSATLPLGARGVQVGDLGADTDWSKALKGVDFVVHAAARVHIMQDKAADPLTEFRRVNVEGTLRLARQAAEAGVRRFLFLSSVKVNGESTVPGYPFDTEQTPVPVDPYGISKLEAENGLFDIGSRSGMEVIIIRPPLIYGPGVKANFQAMMKWLYRGIPLPLAAINNRRSLVGLDNLVDLISLCRTHPEAPNQRFLVSDDEDISTAQLLERMGIALGRPARLFPVPASLLHVAANLVSKQDIAQRLFASLQVDIMKTKKKLGWTPPVSLDEGLRKAAKEYLREANI